MAGEKLTEFVVGFLNLLGVCSRRDIQQLVVTGCRSSNLLSFRRESDQRYVEKQTLLPVYGLI